MSHEDIVSKLEQTGVLRVLLELRDGPKGTSHFQQLMANQTFMKARDVLVGLGLVEVEEGTHRRLTYSLTDRGERVADRLAEIMQEL